MLHKENGGYAIYEVKSSTDVSDVYLWDIAYQKWVLEKAGVNVVGTYLVHINNQYVRHGEINIHEFFKIVDVAEATQPYYPLVAHNIEKAQSYLAQQEEPEMLFGTHCKKPYECAYWKYCSRDIPSPSIFDLYNMHFDKACKYYHDGIITYADAINHGIKLSDKQQTQIEFALSDREIHIDKGGVQDFLNTLWNPLYFLDFETYQTAIPKYDGMKPYQQIPFQYSLHYITGETENGAEKLFHKEYLAKEGTDPRRELAERLIEDIPANACVLAYNKAFECTRIKELAATFPDLKDQLLQIRDNIRDLWDVFKGGHVYNRAMGGSFSIKSVLPALFPNDPNLDYHNLEAVHNGGEATDAFLMLENMTEDERNKTRAALLAYCKLDTMAMVMLWQRLRELLHE